MVKDLKAFMEAIGKDEALQAKMKGIMESSTEENMFANCNAVAKEMGYEIQESDLADLADELDIDMDEAALTKVAGGSIATAVFSILGAVLGASAAVGIAVYNGESKKS